MQKKRVAVLISGSGSNLQALLDAARAADYPAEIVLVISNKAEAYGVVRAQQAGVPVQIISHKDYASREAFDAAMHQQLLAHRVEIVCLAGFMRLLSAGFVQQWQGRMLNIHPSLLPHFKGAHAVRDALAAGAAETGCTVHLVTAEMDEGPVVDQIAVAITSQDDEHALHQRIHAQEHILYPRALRQLIETSIR